MYKQFGKEFQSHKKTVKHDLLILPIYQKQNTIDIHMVKASCYTISNYSLQKIYLIYILTYKYSR